MRKTNLYRRENAKIINRKNLLALAFMLILSLVCLKDAAAMPLEWWVTPPDVITDVNGTTPLPEGSLVQLISMGADAEIDEPDWGTANFGQPGGDDSLLAFIAIGDGYPPLPDGHFYHPGVTYSGAMFGETVYTRAWNESTASASTYYGNSTSSHVLTDEIDEQYNAGSWSTDQAVVPEPSTILLLTTGLFGIAGLKKRLKK